MNPVTEAEWDDFISTQPNVHIFQASAWGELKSHFKWDVLRFYINQCGAQVLIRSLPLGLSLAYIAKGPLGNDWHILWSEIHRFCHEKGCFMLKVEPDLLEEEKKYISAQLPGFFESDCIQPQRTIIIDLEGREDELLERMKQKTRYNIRLAMKKGVKVHTSKDINLFYKIMQMTGDRNQFGIHSKQYYQLAFENFSKTGACQFFVAEFQGEPLAVLMIFIHGHRAWYFYGASTEKERERMPTYLLQWEAIRWAKARGCLEYDLWGVPDKEEHILENNFIKRTDGLWGVYRFKRGFGGKLVRSAGAWDYVYSPIKYRLFSLFNKIRKTQLG